MEMNCDNAVEKMRALYSDLRNSVLTDENVEHIIAELDYEVRFSGAFARDRERWPKGVHANDTSELIWYAKERMKFLDTALYDFSLFGD